MAHCSSSFVECRLSDWLWRILPITLLVIGTAGNTLNIAILSRRALRGYSTSVYLLVLAVSDMLALWSVLPESTSIFLFDQKYLSLSFLHCKFTSWIAYSSSAVSAWTVVNLTIERVILTLYPIKAKMRLSPKLSLMVSLITVLIVQLFTVHLIFGHTLIESIVDEAGYGTNSTGSNSSAEVAKHWNCVLVSQEYRKFFNVTWSYVVLICFSVLPIGIIITGNIIIGYVLFQRKKKVFPTMNLNQLSTRREKLAIKMLFVISCIFIVCTAPYCIYCVVKSYSVGVASPKEEAVDSLINAIVNILLFSNFTFNFALYFARGALFRQEWTKLTTCRNRVAVIRYRRTAPGTTENRTHNTYI